ncbi:MAG: cysteine synthase A [Candidatus Enterosoma sp.]|nr:cysteine synthase A [bacterium]MDY5866547.1 cysteine synthase A [Candidatus Enterosoma sp.]
MNYLENSLMLIGNTPLVKLNSIKEEYDLKCDIFAKIERYNLTGSIKDRPVYNMIINALNEKRIDRNTILVEPTSGNTGIAIAAISAVLKMRAVLFMPENCSIERVKMMKAFGCEIILTKKELGMKGAIEEAEKYHNQHENSVILSQFSNSDNKNMHYLTTGREIYSSLDGKVDIFVAGFGTGGTFSGVSRYLKEQNKDIIAVAVEPFSSPFVSENRKGTHKIQGIGAGFLPDNFDPSLADEILKVHDDDAFFFTRELARKEGLFCGISSGCNLAAAISLARRYEKKNIVTVFPDNGERYLSVEGLYE